MTIQTLLTQLTESPESLQFKTVIAAIDETYDFTPVSFTNGEVTNAAGQNQGSCKILAFGQLHHLSDIQTLACFGEIYRDEVLAYPQGDNHQNIRQFIQHGWAGVTFSSQPLTLK